MGGKKGGAPRQKQRAREVAETLLLSTTTAGQVIETKTDQDLFIIDNEGDSTLRKQIIKQKIKKQKTQKGLPQQMGRKVQKIIHTHKNNPKQIQSMAQEARNKTDISTLKRQQRKIKRTNFDLWGDDTNHKKDDDANHKKDDDTNHKKDDNTNNKDSSKKTANLLKIDPTHNPNLHSTKKIKLIPTTRGVSQSMSGTAPLQFIPFTKSQILNPNLARYAKPSIKTLKNKSHHNQHHARPTVAVDVALPGQSYLPDKEHHQDAIGEALTIEIRRKEAEEEANAPISAGMTEETLAILLPDSDSEDEDNDAHDEQQQQQPTSTSNKLMKKTGKITTSKRNKQKRARQQQLASMARKKQKQLLHSITEVKKIQKELSIKDRELLGKKQMLQQLKQEEKAHPLGVQLYTKLAEKDPLNVPSLPVALTQELQRGTTPSNNTQNPDSNQTLHQPVTSLYSLRTVKPKGSLLKERLESFVDRNMAFRKSTRKKRMTQGKKRKHAKNSELFVI